MRRIALARAGLSVSRLSFGTASLHHVRSRRERTALISAAVDEGFSHFDTSPLYGFGIAEQCLGALDPERARAITVATKVGLYPPAGATPGAASVWLRKAVGRIAPSLSRAVVDWSLDRAARSLERSLRRLARERIDLLLLHEAVPSVLDTEEWRAWLDARRRQGVIGAYGIAGELAPVLGWVRAHPEEDVVLQVRDSLERREAEPLLAMGRPPEWLYGYLSALEPAARRDPSGVLAAALTRAPDSSIIVSTRRAERLRALVAIAEAAEPAPAGAAGSPGRTP